MTRKRTRLIDLSGFRLFAMGRLDLPDPARDEDREYDQRGRKPRGEYLPLRLTRGRRVPWQARSPGRTVNYRQARGESCNVLVRPQSDSIGTRAQ